MNKEEFDIALLECTNDDDIQNFSRKYIVHGIPYVFRQREEDFYDFRNRIARKFNVKYYEVYIVGSAKLGFSFLKNKIFSYDLDIDIALVNEGLFDYFLSAISEFQYNIDSSKTTLSSYEYHLYIKFLKYVVKGWIRPDLLPNSYGIDCMKQDWFDFFKQISYDKSEVGNYKVNAGLYKNYNCLERYCSQSLKQYLAIKQVEGDQ